MEGVKVKIEPGVSAAGDAQGKTASRTNHTSGTAVVIKEEPGVFATKQQKIKPEPGVGVGVSSLKTETLEDIEEKRATQVEVLALRTQVAYLQDTIEDLRKQLDCVLTVLDDTKPGSEDVKGKKKGSKKQQPAKVTKGSKIGMKRPRSFGALPFAKSKVADGEKTSLNSRSNDLKLSPKELSQVCEVLENGDLVEAPTKHMSHEDNEVIRSISEATQLDQDSVCKIIRYFSELTTKEQNESSVTGFDKIEVTLQAQKVGAN